MNSAVRRIAYIAIAIAIGVYAYSALKGPQGVPALLDKQRLIRTLEEENVNLQRDNQYKRERIQRLRSNPAEQEMEIRKSLKLVRPGETEFILPETKKK